MMESKKSGILKSAALWLLRPGFTRAGANPLQDLATLSKVAKARMETQKRTAKPMVFEDLDLAEAQQRFQEFVERSGFSEHDLRVIAHRNVIWCCLHLCLALFSLIMPWSFVRADWSSPMARVLATDLILLPFLIGVVVALFWVFMAVVNLYRYQMIARRRHLSFFRFVQNPAGWWS